MGIYYSKRENELGIYYFKSKWVKVETLELDCQDLAQPLRLKPFSFLISKTER